MRKPAPVQPTRPGAAEAGDSALPVTPEVERIIREDVLADLKARRPLAPPAR